MLHCSFPKYGGVNTEHDNAFRIKFIIGHRRDEEEIVLNTLSVVLNVKIVRKVPPHLSPFQIPLESAEINEAMKVAE